MLAPKTHPDSAHLRQSFAQAFPELNQKARPQLSAGTRLAWLNRDLAQEVGLDPDWLESEAGLAWMTGRAGVGTYAQAYAGFQFGQLSPVLGDGRAQLIGELAYPRKSVGERSASSLVDLHLKGGGRTAFSRPGSDGRSPLTAAWREAVIGEFLHALNVPSSRALAVFDSQERIQRRGPGPEPAGMVLRLAESHLRVGTFQYAQYHCSPELRARLVRYALERHYPHLLEREEGKDRGGAEALALLRGLADRQAQLVASWQGLGFVHGVLNTDNVAISGQAIDFGPCALIDTFKRGQVFSSIDRQGRYSYQQQAGITAWNLARFAETLLDLIDPEQPHRAIHLATEALSDFEDLFLDRHREVFAAKLGLRADLAGQENYRRQLDGLIEETLTALEDYALDFTDFFRSLAEGNCQLPAAAQVAWLEKVNSLRQAGAVGPEEARALMLAHNPAYIPRNLALAAALEELEQGRQGPVEQLLEGIRRPLEPRPGWDYLRKPPLGATNFVSYCGT